MSKNDKELIFQNSQQCHLKGWYFDSPYKTLGCILHWLYVFGITELKEKTTITDDEIICDGNTILKYTWDDQFLMPIFNTFNEEYFVIEKNQQIFIEQAKLKSFVVLEHLTLPDRGFRFWTKNSNDNTKIYTGEIAYQPIFYTNINEEAISWSRQSNSNKIPSFGEMMEYLEEKNKNLYDDEETEENIYNY
jgi:hypothetical protein